MYSAYSLPIYHLVSATIPPNPPTSVPSIIYGPLAFNHPTRVVVAVQRLAARRQTFDKSTQPTPHGLVAFNFGFRLIPRPSNPRHSNQHATAQQSLSRPPAPAFGPTMPPARSHAHSEDATLMQTSYLKGQRARRLKYSRERHLFRLVFFAQNPSLDSPQGSFESSTTALRSVSAMMTAAVSTAISQGWAWKERDVSIASVLDEVGSSWTDATAFPSEIHVELLKAGRIPDPFKGSNEHEVQCESGSISFSLAGTGRMQRDIYRDRRARVVVPHQVRRAGAGAQLEERRVGLRGAGHALRRLPREFFLLCITYAHRRGSRE